MAQLTIDQMASVAYFVSGLWSSVVALVFLEGHREIIIERGTTRLQRWPSW